MTWLLGTIGVLMVCFAIAVMGVRTATKGRSSDMGLGDTLALISPFAFPVFIFFWGVIFEWTGPEDGEPPWRLEATRWLLFLLYPSLCAFSVWRSRGRRLLAAALIPLSLFISLFAAGLAVAFVTGD